MYFKTNSASLGKKLEPMNAIFNKNNFFLKQQTGLLSVTQRYEVYDSETKQQLMKRKEPSFGILKDILRFVGYTASIPFYITVSDMSGTQLFSVRRRFSLFRPNVKVFDENEICVGTIKRSAWWAFMADNFRIRDAEGKKLCSFNNNLYSFSKSDTEFAHLSGDIKNLRADLIDITDEFKMQFKGTVPQNDPLRILIFGAVMSVDLLVQERAKNKPLRGGLGFDI